MSTADEVERLQAELDVLKAEMVEHEKQVRERVAEEILAAERALAATDPATEDALIVSGIHARGLLQAARIARGES